MKKQNLKVWSGNWDGSRCIIAATSAREAAEILDVSLSEFRTYGTVTGHEGDIAHATAHPGAVFRTRGWGDDREYERVR